MAKTLPQNVDEIWWDLTMDDIEELILEGLRTRSKKYERNYGLEVNGKYLLISIRRSQ